MVELYVQLLHTTKHFEFFLNSSFVAIVTKTTNIEEGTTEFGEPVHGSSSSNIPARPTRDRKSREFPDSGKKSKFVHGLKIHCIRNCLSHSKDYGNVQLKEYLI